LGSDFARRLAAEYINDYNMVPTHSAIASVMPPDELVG
jgi:hypothetical protein